MEVKESSSQTPLPKKDTLKKWYLQKIAPGPLRTDEKSINIVQPTATGWEAAGHHRWRLCFEAFRGPVSAARKLAGGVRRQASLLQLGRGFGTGIQIPPRIWGSDFATTVNLSSLENHVYLGRLFFPHSEKFNLLNIVIRLRKMYRWLRMERSCWIGCCCWTCLQSCAAHLKNPGIIPTPLT